MDVFLFNMHLLFFCTIIKLNICINQLCKSVCLIIFCLFITISNNVLNTGCKCCIFRANKSRLLWELSLFGFLLSAEVKKINKNGSVLYLLALEPHSSDMAVCKTLFLLLFQRTDPCGDRPDIHCMGSLDSPLSQVKCWVKRDKTISFLFPDTC